jgi:RimJ/RimL family protein N-acetyltransferase
MENIIETERLLLRKIVADDEQGMFELDNNPEVHRYLGNRSISTIDEARSVIKFIQQQYIDNGIGRWAVVEKGTNTFIGWAGFKLIKNIVNGYVDYYDIGYRLIKKYWRRGFATEAAMACLDYGFDKMDLETIYGMADVGNTASKNVLEKIGLNYIEKFTFEGIEHNWFRITKNDWVNKKYYDS